MGIWIACLTTSSNGKETLQGGSEFHKCHSVHHARHCGARWVKLNQNPVCYGGKGSDYGSFKVDTDVLIHKVKFVYRSGGIFCNPTKKAGYFGCPYAGLVEDYFAVFLTDTTNNPVVPASPVFFGENRGSPMRGWYRVQGHKTFATTVTLSTGSSSFQLKAGQEFRIWHGEDLFNNWETNNSGKTCADVYGLV